MISVEVFVQDSVFREHKSELVAVKQQKLQRTFTVLLFLFLKASKTVCFY